MRSRLFIIVALLFLVQMPLCAQSLSERQDRRTRLEKEIAILESQIRAASAKSSNAMNSLTLVQRKIAVRKRLVADSDHQIRVLNDSLYARQKEINRIQQRLDTMTVYYGRLVKNAYKNRDARIWYMYILASDNLGQAGRRYSYLRSLSTQMNVQARKIMETREELELQKEALMKMRAEAKTLRDRQAAELSELQKEEKQSQSLISRLKKDKNTYQKQLNTKKKQVDALNREIERLIASEVSGSRTKKSDPVDYKLAGEFESNKGKLPWPAEGSVIEHFGQHYHPVYKSVKLPFNNGVNIAVAPGTYAKAVFSGVVKQVIVMPGYGQCVLVQHGNYFTFYCKLTAVGVKAGQKITTGQELGRIDTISSETQLHFQLWKGKAPQDPENWLRPRG